MKKRYCVTILVLVMLVLTAMLAIILSVHITNGEIRDSSVEMGSELLIGEMANKAVQSRELKFYGDIGSSLEDAIGEKTERGEEIIRFQKGDYLFILFRGKIGGILAIPAAYHVLFKMEEGKVSSPLYYGVTGIKQSLGKTGMFYDEEDRVVKDIDASYRSEGVTELANDGIPIYYGVCMEPEAKQLTILGQSPTDVIPFEWKDKTYYLWYYLEETGFGAVYAKDIDPSVTTMAEMINIYDIRFDGSTQ